MRKPTEQDLKLCPDNVREAYLAMVKECKAWREFDAEAEERSWSKAWYVHADRLAAVQDETDAVLDL